MPKQTLRLSAFGELKACGNNCAPFFVFNSALTHLRIHISLVARFETADKTVSASRNASAMLSFLPHPLAPLSRGAGSFAAEGLTAVSSSLHNKVAPTARIYLHLICRKRHLPLKLRKGKTFRVQTKICTNIAQIPRDARRYDFRQCIDTGTPE